jgi:hypothetical protein
MDPKLPSKTERIVVNELRYHAELGEVANSTGNHAELGEVANSKCENIQRGFPLDSKMGTQILVFGTTLACLTLDTSDSTFHPNC